MSDQIAMDRGPRFLATPGPAEFGLLLGYNDFATVPGIWAGAAFPHCPGKGRSGRILRSQPVHLSSSVQTEDQLESGSAFCWFILASVLRAISATTE